MNLFELLKNILNDIEEHIEDITLEKIAENHFISLSYMHKIFSTVMGISLKSYIIKRRLSWASIDLVQSDMRIIDIAVKYNYESYEGFSRIFKKYYGISPKGFRKRNQRSILIEQLCIETVVFCKGGELMQENSKQIIEGIMGQYIIGADIDRFATYNETLGFEGGNIVIEAARKRLERYITPQMEIQRVGADEFIIITKSNDFEEIQSIASKIIDEAKLEVKVYDEVIKFTMSLGIVKITSEQINHEEVLEIARIAMLDAKKSGKNCYKILNK